MAIFVVLSWFYNSLIKILIVLQNHSNCGSNNFKLIIYQIIMPIYVESPWSDGTVKSFPYCS